MFMRVLKFYGDGSVDSICYIFWTSGEIEFKSYLLIFILKEIKRSRGRLSDLLKN